MEVIQRICEEFSNKKANILFRFTIGSTNSDTLKFWEPGAPSFEERLESLKHAHDMGFSTSISSEPVLDSNSNELIETLLPFVSDAIWIGKPNRLKSIMKVNGANDPESVYKADELMKQLNNQWALELYNCY